MLSLFLNLSSSVLNVSDNQFSSAFADTALLDSVRGR